MARGVAKAATEVGAIVRSPTERGDAPPSVVVIDLEQPGAADEVARLRAEYPDALLVGHLAVPQRERWVEAERAGCDLVANRGAVARQLRERLGAPGGAARRRFPLVDAADAAGRLGFVSRVPGTPFGAVAVYRVGGRLCAVADACPHAGASLSEGEVEGAVVTCPRHGSRFDVGTGERLRGPADQELRTFDVVEDGGRVDLVWGGGPG